MTERVSALQDEHKKLNAEMMEWNGMQVVARYPAHTVEEIVDAVRDAAGLYDLTAFRKLRITGPDAHEVLDRAITRTTAKLVAGKATYAMTLNDDAGIADDGIAFCYGPNDFSWVIGTGTSGERFEKAAEGKNVKLEWDNETQVLSVQGPKSADILAPHIEGGDFRAQRPFQHGDFKLFGRDAHISRTGYSGERGYEIYCAPADAPYLWQKILEAGKPHGLLPGDFASLNPLRTEAGLLFYPFDANPDNTPWEVSYGFLVTKDKGDFLGKEACLAKEKSPRHLLLGIAHKADKALWEGGEEVLKDGKKVGEVNIGDYSHRMGKALGYVFVDPSIKEGDKVTVNGTEVTIENLPFYDKEKMRPRA